MEHGRGDAEVDDVLRLWSRLSRRRESRGRVGVLEDVLFAVWIFRGYLARPETDDYRSEAMEILGRALRASGRPKEALPVFEANVALTRWPRAEDSILRTQTNVACCLGDLGRRDEALVLERDIYARTIIAGLNVSLTLQHLELWEQSKPLLRDLLPAARRSLGSEHQVTLSISHGLATALAASPEGTRDDPRVNQPSRAGAASTVFNLTPGDDRLQAESIAQDVLSRRRRVFGPAHPATRRSESLLSQVRSTL